MLADTTVDPRLEAILLQLEDPTLQGNVMRKHASFNIATQKANIDLMEAEIQFQRVASAIHVPLILERMRDAGAGIDQLEASNAERIVAAVGRRYKALIWRMRARNFVLSGYPADDAATYADRIMHPILNGRRPKTRWV